MIDWNKFETSGMIPDSLTASIVQRARAISDDCAVLPDDQYASVASCILRALGHISREMEDLPPMMKFRIQFESCMDIADMEILCADLNVAFENIRGDSKSVKTVSLVREFQKRRQLPVFLDYLRKLRPKTAWVDIGVAAKTR